MDFQKNMEKYLTNFDKSIDGSRVVCYNKFEINSFVGGLFMKKLLCLTVSLLMILGLCLLPLSAAEGTAPNADAVFTLSDAEGFTGDTVTLALHVSASALYDVFGLRFREEDPNIRYYPDILSALSFSGYENNAAFSTLSAFEATPENDYESKQSISVSLKAPENDGIYTGLICHIEFKISKNAKPGVYTVGEGMFHNVVYKGQKLTSDVIPAQLTVMHKTTFFPAVESTCTVNGNPAYYKCNTCRGYFADPLCQTPITDRILPRTAHTLHHAYDESSHFEQCTVCEARFNVAVHTDSDSLWNIDGTSHWHECTCGQTFDNSAHTGTAATCKAGAKCSVCGEEYTEKSSEHGKTVIRGYRAPTCNTEGFTGVTYCTVCSEVIDEGQSIPADAAKHAATDPTWYTDGTSHWQLCGGDQCNEHLNSGTHTGGTATCKTPARCSICKLTYGGLDPAKHTGSFEIRDAVTATCGKDGYTGDIYCLGCETISVRGTTVQSTGAHIDADGKWEGDTSGHWHTCGCDNKFDFTDKHTVGTPATCSAQAVCADCGVSFGAKDSKNHTGKTELRGAKAATCGADGFTGDRYCLTCNALIRKGTVIAATGNHVDKDGAWSYDENGGYHYYVCGCEKTFLSMPHTFSPKQDQHSHWQECTACGYKKDTTEHTYPVDTAHYYRDAEGHSHVCEDCGYKGTVEKHSYESGSTVCFSCGYEDLTAVEISIKAAELQEQNKDASQTEPISDMQAITEILDLKQQIESTEDAAAKDKETINSMLEKVNVISVDTVTENTSSGTDAADQITITAAPEDALALVKNVSAEDAAALSLAVRETEEDDVLPTLLFSFKVEPVQQTTPGKDIADEYVTDTGVSAGGQLTVASQLDISIEKKLVVGDTVKSASTVTELEEEFTFILALPKEEVDAGKKFVLLQTHRHEDGTYTTEELKDHDEDPYTYTVITKKFSVYTLCTASTAVSVAADRSNDGHIRATVTLYNAPKSRLITAFYGQNGRMYDISISEVSGTAPTEIVYESSSKSAVTSVKVFLLTEQYLPICAAAALALPSIGT